MEYNGKNLVIILGPTGVGKSATSIKIAKKFDGEIINFDSMQVYKVIDIITDKIPLDKRENIPHHLLDMVSPETQFTAAHFAQLAVESINLVLKNNRLPIIVGGTGLYLKALLEGLFPGPSSSSRLRHKMEEEIQKYGLGKLADRLKAVDPDYYAKIGKNDKMRILRALEVYELTNIPFSQHFQHTKPYLTDLNTIKIGLNLPRSELYRRIEERVDKMFKKGIIKEVEVLLERGVEETSPPFRALGYKYVLKYLRKELSREESIFLTKRDTRHYAKRQITWINKMRGITWFSPFDFTSLASFIKKRLQ